MKEQFGDLNQFMEEQLKKEAEEIERELSEHPELAGMSPSEDVREGLYGRIDEYHREKVIRQLSKEDQEALRLGRQMQKQQKDAAEEKKIRKKSRVWKSVVAACVGLVLIAGTGITSMGGPEKIVEVIQQTVGGRKVLQTESDNDKTKKSDKNKEEEAYQKIEDKLGIIPVRMIQKSSGLKFQRLDLDKQLQIAYMYYEKNGKTLVYCINLLYADDSLGRDVEDKLVNEYSYQIEACPVIIRQYEVAESREIKNVAEFTYEGVYYQITGRIKAEELEEILNNLYFL